MSTGQRFGGVHLAALWMLGALVSFVAMAIAARELSAQLSTFQILFFRSLVGLLVLLALLARHGFWQVKTQHFGTHLARNVVHLAGQFGWFYAIAFIPLAAVFAIEFTVPLWTALFAFLLLGERLSLRRITAIACGIAGILVILRPGQDVMHPAALAVLGCAVCYGMTHTLTKSLSAHQRPLTILFYMTVIQLPLAGIPASIDWVTPSPLLWPALVIVGITALTAHYCIVRALVLADATVVVPMDFLRLPVIAVVGFFLYDESLSWALVVGAALIIGGNLLNLWQRREA